MRILLINYEYPPVGGGAANATWEIARAMVKLAHEPVVLTAHYRNRKRDHDNPQIKIIQVPAARRRVDRCSIFEMTTFVLSAAWHIRKVLRDERIEAQIAFFSIPCGPIAWWGWRRLRTPYIVSLRGGEVPGMEPSLKGLHLILRPIRRRLMESACSIVANSDSLKAAAQEADPCEIVVIPNGVDAEFWKPGLPVTKRETTFLFVGRLQPQKNLNAFVDALGCLLKSSRIDNIRVEIVGDGPERVPIEKRLAEEGLSPYVRIYGWLGKRALLEKYQHSDCLVNISSYEGHPNVVLEASASGIPAILSNHGIHQQICVSSELLVEPQKTQELAALLYRIATQRSWLAELKGRARKIALEYSWMAAAEKYCEILTTTKLSRAD